MTNRGYFGRFVTGAAGLALLGSVWGPPIAWGSPINAPNARALFAARAWAQQHGPQEIASKKADGLEVTLIAAPPIGPEEMAKRMPGMMAMPGMDPTPGMTPTHWLGVIIVDLNTGQAVKGLSVTLAAKGKGVTRERELIGMPGSYANNISLPARGAYEILVKIAGPPLKQALEALFDFEYR